MKDRYEIGIESMREHLGKDADKYVDAIRDVAPLFAKINVECAFGDVYGDPNSVLDQKQKELCTIAALTVQGFSLPQLKLHIGCALNCGANMKEIVEVITQMILYGGFPCATNAILTAKAVFEERGLLKK
jgi:4-carboxymuconolactone decarboxylase